MEKKKFAIVIREIGVYQAQWFAGLDEEDWYVKSKNLSGAKIFDHEEDAIITCQSIFYKAEKIEDVLSVVEL